MRIVDRGPGIPRAQLERVFEPFYRSGTEQTGHRGSGLGLAIARGFVEVNGGRVWAESLPGQGASFANMTSYSRGLNGVMITEQETTRTVHLVAEPWMQPVSQPIVVVGRVEVNSPLRNESAALPVELVIVGKAVAGQR